MEVDGDIEMCGSLPEASERGGSYDQEVRDDLDMGDVLAEGLCEESSSDHKFEATRTDEGTSSEDFPDDCFVCLASCCHHYERAFITYPQYLRHIKSHAHISAAAIGAGLFSQNLTEDQLEQKRAALRGFCCDSQGCNDFEHVFSSGQSFYNHIQKRTHLRPRAAEEDREARKLEKLREKAAQPTICTVELCPKVRFEYMTADKYKNHAGTIAHQRAVVYMQNHEPKTLDAKAGQKKAGWVGAEPLTPPKDGAGSGPVTPVGMPRGVAEEGLERSNMELEKRVKELEGEVARYRQSLRALGALAFGEN